MTQASSGAGTEGRPVKKLGARHRARRRAVDILFEAEARGILDRFDRATTLPALVVERRELAVEDAAMPPVSEYTGALVSGVATDFDQVDAVLSSNLKDWTLERLPAVDRAILRVAVWELFHADEVPPAVVVDEAIELAKELSTDESPGYVNGVLGNVAALAPQVRAAARAATASPNPDSAGAGPAGPGAAGPGAAGPEAAGPEAAGTEAAGGGTDGDDSGAGSVGSEPTE